MNFLKYKPAVPQKWLIGLAGILWSGVGAMLCIQAFFWLKAAAVEQVVPLSIGGILLACIAYRFIFSQIAQSNIYRIGSLSTESCIFAFQAWKSYLVIVLMVVIGLVLRGSPFPKHYLSVVYIAIGGALFLSSLKYYTRLK